MSMIEDVVLRRVLDSRGNPTVEAEVYTTSGYGRAMAPSGASTGVHEVKAFPDGGVDAGISFFTEKARPKLLGMDALDQAGVDSLLHEVDGSENFSNMGGNTAVAVSLAVAKAAASVLDIPLYRYIGGLGVFSHTDFPRPLGNVIGGGKHAVGGTDIQEFLAIPLSGNASETVFANARIHSVVKGILRKRLPGVALGKGDEGAWVVPLSNTEALEVLCEACKTVSEETGLEIRPSLDMAASELYRDGKYVYKERTLSPGEQIDFVVSLVEDYGLHIVEDPLEQEDFEGYRELTKKIGHRAIILGDDIFVTNVKRIKKGVEMGACNAVLIKPNQIGTLTDTLRAVELAHRNGYRTVVSHRSGETTDESIAHIAVGVGAYAIKTGVVGGERIAKLNELIRIEGDMRR